LKKERGKPRRGGKKTNDSMPRSFTNNKGACTIGDGNIGGKGARGMMERYAQSPTLIRVKVAVLRKPDRGRRGGGRRATLKPGLRAIKTGGQKKGDIVRL